VSATKVLVVAHGHPESSRGGAEQAAYDEFKALQRLPGVQASLLARAPLAQGHGGTPFSVQAENEYLFHSDMVDFFRLSQPIKHMVWSGFRKFLERMRPDVVHFHHYFQLGIELISEVRRTLPNARIVLTLHEFWAICHREGLMVRTDANRTLCDRANPKACHQCFPKYSPEDFCCATRSSRPIWPGLTSSSRPASSCGNATCSGACPQTACT